MKAKSQVGVAAAILFAVTSVATLRANAQQRVSSPIARPIPVRARPVAGHVVSHAPAARRTAPVVRPAVHFNPLTNSFQAADGSFVSLQDLLNPVPGLGFDYHHLSVINSDLAIKAFIDPVTELKLAAARRSLRHAGFGGPGYLIWDGGAYYPVSDDSPAASDQPAPPDQAEQQQPQVIVVQAPPAQQSSDPSSADEEAPLADVGQFTLVLLNGRELQAVAFSHVHDEIVYITADGNRRTFPATDLNSDATVRINEERGTPLQLPL
jgi:hypothetical protein